MEGVRHERDVGRGARGGVGRGRPGGGPPLALYFMSSPIVLGGGTTVFAVNFEGTVMSVDAATGNKLYVAEMSPGMDRQSRGVPGGGPRRVHLHHRLRGLPARVHRGRRLSHGALPLVRPGIASDIVLSPPPPAAAVAGRCRVSANLAHRRGELPPPPPELPPPPPNPPPPPMAPAADFHGAIVACPEGRWRLTSTSTRGAPTASRYSLCRAIWPHDLCPRELSARRKTRLPGIARRVQSGSGRTRWAADVLPGMQHDGVVSRRGPVQSWAQGLGVQRVREGWFIFQGSCFPCQKNARYYSLIFMGVCVHP